MALKAQVTTRKGWGMPALTSDYKLVQVPVAADSRGKLETKLHGEEKLSYPTDIRRMAYSVGSFLKSQDEMDR